MAAIFDAASSGQTISFPLTVPHTVGAGENPGLVTGLFMKREDAPGDVTGILFDGVPMVQHALFDEFGIFKLYLYKLAAPMQGASGDVVISGTPVDFLSAINISALGVLQADVLGAAVSARGDSATSSLVTIVDGLIGGLLVDNHVVSSGSDPTPLANQTERGEEFAAGPGQRQNMSTKAGSDGGGMGWAWASPSTWFMLAAAIKGEPLHPTQAISLARQKTSSIILNAGDFE